MIYLKDNNKRGGKEVETDKKLDEDILKEDAAENEEIDKAAEDINEETDNDKAEASLEDDKEEAGTDESDKSASG